MTGEQIAPLFHADQELGVVIMGNEILIALFSLIGTIVGSGGGILVSNKLVNYRLEQLEKKVDKYSEKEDEVIKELALTKRDLETAFIRIDELREEVNKIYKKGE